MGTGSPAFSPTGEVSFLDTTSGNASLGKAALGATATSTFTTGSTLDVDGLPVYVAMDETSTAMAFPIRRSPVGLAYVYIPGEGDGTLQKRSILPAPIPSAISQVVLLSTVTDPHLVLDHSDNSLVILLGNGDGTFTTKSTITGVSGIAAVADFNGDGIPDLAAANGDYHTLTVLLGNGMHIYYQILRQYCQRHLVHRHRRFQWRWHSRPGHCNLRGRILQCRYRHGVAWEW